jgi:energy-coupling factor transport system substrate-specific component
MSLTSGVIKFSTKNALVLAIASCFSIAGFIWPFFYSGKDLPRTQFFFWVAIAAAFLLVVLEVSSTHLDAKSVALLGVLAALISALRPLGAGARRPRPAAPG